MKRKDRGAQPRAAGMAWWWLAFAVADPRPRVFGVVVVHAHTPEEALRVVEAIGCGPERPGEVMSVEVPRGAGPPPAGYANRLLDDAEMRQMMALWQPDDPVVTTIGELADAGDPDALRVLGEELPS